MFEVGKRLWMSGMPLVRIVLTLWDMDALTGARAAVIARMDRDALTEKLTNGGHEGVILRELQTSESVVGGLETTREWRSVVRLRVRDLLHRNLVGPEVVRNQRLLDTVWGQVGVEPLISRVAVEFRPIAVPCWRAVVRLRRVVHSLAVPAHEQHLVRRVQRRGRVQCVDLGFEFLPLREVGRKPVGGRVRTIDEPKIGCSLVSFSLGFLAHCRLYLRSRRSTRSWSGCPAKSSLLRWCS